MTFKYTDNYHSRPINEDLNRKIEQAESEGFGGLFVSAFLNDTPEVKALISKQNDLIKKFPRQFEAKSGKKIVYPPAYMEAFRQIGELGKQINVLRSGAFYTKASLNKIPMKKDFSFYPVKKVKGNIPVKKTKAQKIKLNIKSAQMHGFANDAKDMIQDYTGGFHGDETMGFGVKFKVKAPKIKAPSIVKKIVKPVVGIVKAPVKAVTKTVPKAVAGLVKRPIASLVKPVAKVVAPVTKIATIPLTTAAKIVAPVVTPVMGVVSSIPVVGQVVQPALQTAVGVVGMVPLVGAPISNVVADVATKSGVLQNIPVPSGYASTPEEKIIIEPAKTPAPMLPSASYTSPAPMVSSPMSQSGSFTPNISSSSMPSGSSSGSEGGGGGGYSSSKSAQESEDKEESNDKAEIKKPIIAEAKKSNAPKVLGALGVLGALYLWNK
jgi:hypothetical protein